jgi:hypothetical protein
MVKLTDCSLLPLLFHVESIYGSNNAFENRDNWFGLSERSGCISEERSGEETQSARSKSCGQLVVDSKASLALDQPGNRCVIFQSAVDNLLLISVNVVAEVMCDVESEVRK